MSITKKIFLYIIPLFLYLLQTSHPVHFTISNITPNLIFCFGVALAIVFGLKNIWPVILIAMIILETSTSLGWGLSSLVFVIALLIAAQLKKIITDRVLSYLIIPVAVSILYGLLMLILAFVSVHYSYSMAGSLILAVIMSEMLAHYIIILLFIGLINLFFSPKKPPLEFQL